MIKTFWPGFTDRQHPDGTIEWTTPTGHTYTTRPGSTLLFLDWTTTTSALPEPAASPPPNPNRALMMPKRKRTRAAERQTRINAERALNKADDTPHHRSEHVVAAVKGIADSPVHRPASLPTPGRFLAGAPLTGPHDEFAQFVEPQHHRSHGDRNAPMRQVE